MHADYRAFGRDLVPAPHDRHEILDDDLPHLRIVQVNRALGIAPSIAGRLRVRKAIAVVPDVAISSDVVEDQINSGPERPNQILGIDVEPADFAPRHRLIETLQDNIVHGSRQARRPILLFQLLGRSRWSVQRPNSKRAANGQRCKGSDPWLSHGNLVVSMARAPAPAY